MHIKHHIHQICQYSTSNIIKRSFFFFFISLNLILSFKSNLVECKNKKYDPRLYDGLNELVDYYTRSYKHNDNDNNDYLDNYSMDVAIKLKREFADELVSDLFATSHGIEKVARIEDLDSENSLFHFKLKNVPFESDDMIPIQYGTKSNKTHSRTKRHVYTKIDVLRRDDRVEYVLPQYYLSRHKRRWIDYKEDDENENLINEIAYEIDHSYKKSKHQLKNSDINNIQTDLDELAKRVEFEMDSRKNGPNSFSYHNKHLNDTTLYDIYKSNMSGQIKNDKINFNDESFKLQWYLIDDGQLKIPLFNDLNVKSAWLSGYTGKNVTIVIVDDGLDYEHPDFVGKYRADLSYDFNDENDTQHDPMPATFDDQNNHGTRCAGAAAANANNSVCGVGVAYNAQIAGIRILDGPITDLLEAKALSYKSKQVDIRSASWGPKDDGQHMEYPGKLVNLALEEGVKNGRNGKGTLYVWASGNGGGNDDDCSCDGYVSHWNIISIGSVNHRGMKPYFMELCPSTMAVVYSGGQTKIKGDKDDPGVRVITSDVRGKCTKTFQGTSSAAPLAAGALALVLEANPELTYRDVMHLIAKTSRIPNIEDTDGWILNGAGYHVNEKYGFGVLDVAHMLEMAQKWENVPERQRCEIQFDNHPKLTGNDNITLILKVSGSDCTNITQIEHTIANISFSYPSRGDIKLKLISPSDTVSEILSYRKNDRSNKGVNYFPFMTLFNWGESPIGQWKLIIETRTRNDTTEKYTGSIDYLSLVFYGSKKSQEPKKRFVDQLQQKAYIPTAQEVVKMYDTEIKVAREARIIDKRVFEENSELRNLLKNSVIEE